MQRPRIASSGLVHVSCIELSGSRKRTEEGYAEEDLIIVDNDDVRCHSKWKKTSGPRLRCKQGVQTLFSQDRKESRKEMEDDYGQQ